MHGSHRTRRRKRTRDRSISLSSYVPRVTGPIFGRHTGHKRFPKQKLACVLNPWHHRPPHTSFFNPRYHELRPSALMGGCTLLRGDGAAMVDGEGCRRSRAEPMNDELTMLQPRHFFVGTSYAGSSYQHRRELQPVRGAITNRGGIGHRYFFWTL